MIGRVEVLEILGMAGTCAVLLFAGFSVETLEGDVRPSWAAIVEVRAPDLVDSLELPQEVRLQLPVLERPVHPAPPALSLEPAVEPVHRPSACSYPRVSS